MATVLVVEDGGGGNTAIRTSHGATKVGKFVCVCVREREETKWENGGDERRVGERSVEAAIAMRREGEIVREILEEGELGQDEKIISG